MREVGALGLVPRRLPGQLREPVVHIVIPQMILGAAEGRGRASSRCPFPPWSPGREPAGAGCRPRGQAVPGLGTCCA